MNTSTHLLLPHPQMMLNGNPLFALCLFHDNDTHMVPHPTHLILTSLQPSFLLCTSLPMVHHGVKTTGKHPHMTSSSSWTLITFLLLCRVRYSNRRMLRWIEVKRTAHTHYFFFHHPTQLSLAATWIMKFFSDSTLVWRDITHEKSQSASFSVSAGANAAAALPILPTRTTLSHNSFQFCVGRPIYKVNMFTTW
jgi:hypothetical protein